MADSYADNVDPLYDTQPGAYLHVQPDEVVPDAIDNPMYFKEGQVEGAGAGTGYMAVEPDWLSEQWDMLSDQPWFRGFQNRDECEQELNAYPPGGFVVRVSVSEPGHYAISCIQHGNDFDHMLILPSRAADTGTSAPGGTRYRLGTYTKELFNTVPKLVAYYIDHAYIDKRRLQGHVRPETQVGGYVEVNPTAPPWLRGEMGREKAEGILAGGQPGHFLLRTKRGQGHVLSMVLPLEYDNKFRHHLVKADGGEWTVDKFGVGQHRSVEDLVSQLQTDTLGVLACPLLVSDFDEPSFEPNFAEPAGYDQGTNDTGYAANSEALYDSAADGQGAMYQDVAPEDPYSDDVQVAGAGGDPLYDESANYNEGADPLYSDTPGGYTGGEALYDEAADASGGRPEGAYGEAGDMGLDGDNG